MESTVKSNSSDLPDNMVRLRGENIGGTTVPLLDNDNLSDIFFICGDDLVPIQSHRLVLRNWSDFLSNVINATLLIKGPFPVAPFIVLKEVCGKDLQDIFTFIYKGQVTLERSRIGSLVKTARFLEIKQLPDLIEKSGEFKDEIEAAGRLSSKNSESTIIRSDATDATKSPDGSSLNSDGNLSADVNMIVDIPDQGSEAHELASNIPEKSSNTPVDNSEPPVKSSDTSEPSSGTLKEIFKTSGFNTDNLGQSAEIPGLSSDTLEKSSEVEDRIPEVASNSSDDIGQSSLHLIERLKIGAAKMNACYTPLYTNEVLPLKPENERSTTPMDEGEIIDLTSDPSESEG